MLRTKFAALVCAVLTAVMLTGCTSKRQLYSDFIPDQKIDEDMILTTEFPEYDGNAEKITLLVTNNGDEEFITGSQFYMQKKENGEWRGIAVTGAFNLLAQIFPPSTSDVEYYAVLKDHVLQPLPSGTYRIGISTDPRVDDEGLYKNGRIAYSSDFTIR